MYVWGWVWPGAFEGPGGNVMSAECEVIMCGNFQKWKFGGGSMFAIIPFCTLEAMKFCK